MWKKLASWFPANRTSNIKRMAALWPVDIHNHLVPGIDDGVKTVEEAMQCLRQFAEWGVRQVISTPHISQDYFPNTVTQIQEAAQAVNQAIREEELPITFSVAAEYLLDEYFNELVAKQELLSFGQERYVMIETGWATAPLHLDQTLFAIQRKGYTPILAHPERYRYYQDKLEDLLSLQEKGCLFQLNLMSLTGRYGTSVQTLAKELLKQQCIHFIASDLHKAADLEELTKAFVPATYALLAKQPLRNATLLDQR